MDGTMQRLSSKCLIVISQLAFWSVLVPHGVCAQLATTWNVSYGGTSRAEEINISYEAELSKLGFGDFNGDGRTDVFYTHPGQGWFVSYGGTGRWEKINDYRVPVEELAFGDFNGDGKTDVFHRPPNSRDWLVSYGGTQRWVKINESKADLKEMAFGDFNGDGKTDVFFLGIPSRPKAPSDLRITKVDGRAMTVMWQDNSDREDGFHIRWVGTRPDYTTSDRSRTLKKRNIDSHSETNLSEGYTYCISVQAFNRGGKSPSSNEVCHMIPVSDKPSPFDSEYINRRDFALTLADPTLEASWVIGIEMPPPPGSSDPGLCSGSVLAERWILTAAHCVSDQPRRFPVTVYYAHALAARMIIYKGGAIRHVYPYYQTLPFAEIDPHDDIALIELVDGQINLSLTGRAKLYDTTGYIDEIWAREKDDRRFMVIGWGRTNEPNSKRCVKGTAGVKRKGDWFVIRTAGRFATSLKADRLAGHICPGDSGAPWLLKRGDHHVAFAIHSGRWPHFYYPPPVRFPPIPRGFRDIATVIKPKMKWIQGIKSPGYDASTGTYYDRYLSCVRGGYLGDPPYVELYLECNERRQVLPDPPPPLPPCPAGQRCCEPFGDRCHLCVPIGSRRP